MMMNSPEFGEVAAKFFERIGAETNTCVIWPSRLKVGAKSKKDPHIRVGGCKEGVRRAKTMIMEVLDTTTNSRVTMKIDVFYTDRSHIIGKGGNTIFPTYPCAQWLKCSGGGGEYPRGEISGW